jgi:hypothetical protein
MEETKTRHCCRCHEDKPIAAFARGRRGGLQYHCRACQALYHKEHYAKNKKRYIQQARQRQKRLQAEVRAIKDQPCAECGQRYPFYVMDFDHREGHKKVAVINRMVMLGWSRDRILAEIAKCDVVCANCHRERTWQRKQNAKKQSAAAAPVDPDRPA